MATCSSLDWKRAIYSYAAENSIDVLHIHDLPLLGVALEVGRQLGIRVVADLHENYPEMLAELLRSTWSGAITPSQVIQHFTVSLDRWKRYEERVVPQADEVIVVIEEARDRLVQMGVPPERLHVVANYTPLSDLSAPQGSPQAVNDHFNVLYAGGFAATRDLYAVMDAVALLSPEEVPNLRVVMLGGKGAELEFMLRYARDKGVQDRVVLTDWRPMEEVMKQIRRSRVCLVPHVKSPHTDATIPHKLFQYMAYKRPVIVSNCAPLERIVTETGCGLVYRSGDATTLADCLRRLYHDPQACSYMGEAGFRAVRDKYNWEQTGGELQRLYRQIAVK